MKIKQVILDQINNPQSRQRIGLEIGIGDRMLAKHITNNTPDGMLTRMKALIAISKETGVAVDNILENEVTATVGDE